MSLSMMSAIPKKNLMLFSARMAGWTSGRRTGTQANQDVFYSEYPSGGLPNARTTERPAEVCHVCVDRGCPGRSACAPGASEC